MTASPEMLYGILQNSLARSMEREGVYQRLRLSKMHILTFIVIGSEDTVADIFAYRCSLIK
jgi:hypothetical protein